jgi:DNA-binding response OmpR family regulator
MAKVMFVNDEPDLGTLVQMVLEDHGHAVVMTTDGERALDIARREQPDLVILDWVLGRMTGDEVLRWLRDDPATARIPVLLASAMVDLHDRARRLGADAVLEKPYSTEELHSAVERVLALRSGDRASP